MGQQTAIRHKVSGAVLASAMSVSALASMGLGVAPTAGASCASFFGIGNSAACSSTLTTVAIAIGTNAQAHANGILGGAFAMGNDTLALFNSGGRLGLAIGLGADTITQAGSGFADIAINVTTATVEHTVVSVMGTANIAVNLFGAASGVFGHVVGAQGIGNVALNLLGSDNQVLAGTSQSSFGNTAFNILGSHNDVTAGPGPLSLAGAFGQTGLTVIKAGPGFNLGLQVGAPAAARSQRKAAPRVTLGARDGAHPPTTVTVDKPATTKSGDTGHARKAVAGRIKS